MEHGPRYNASIRAAELKERKNQARQKLEQFGIYTWDKFTFVVSLALSELAHSKNPDPGYREQIRHIINEGRICFASRKAPRNLPQEKLTRYERAQVELRRIMTKATVLGLYNN